MSKVAIIGVGQSNFVRSYPGSIRELAFEAYKEAMQDAGLTAGDIDASVVCSAPEYDKQRSPAGVFAEYLGLNPQPTFYVESLCSSSSMGVRLAYSLVKSGLHDVVAVIGFQKMSEITSSESQERMGRGADIQWESPFGTMMPAYYAMYARGHMEKYGTTPEDLALIRDLAGRIVEKRLQAPAVFFLEASRPLSFMASQAMIFLGPLVQAVYPMKQYRRVAELLEDRENVDRLIQAIEEQAKEREKKQ